MLGFATEVADLLLLPMYSTWSVARELGQILLPLRRTSGEQEGGGGGGGGEG